MRQTFSMLLWEHATTLKRPWYQTPKWNLSHLVLICKNTLSHARSLGYNQKLNQNFKNWELYFSTMPQHLRASAIHHHRYVALK